MKLIYESKRPKFAILVDQYQWILAWKTAKITDKNPNGWKADSYFPYLELLLEDLYETLGRKFAKPVNTLDELSDSFKKAQKVIDRVAREREVVGAGLPKTKDDDW